MISGAFKFEDDLLKHYVRVKGWLPLCSARNRRLRRRVPRLRRSLRYFTFCAVNAVDVLMLDLAGVIKRSDSGRFDSVYFFDRTLELVAQTQDRIPGSIGFHGDFLKTVLAPYEHVDLHQAPDGGGDPLSALTEEENRRDVRKRQVLQAIKRDFQSAFPFDVLNLDLQDFAFKPKDKIPGDVIRALHRLCEWQRRPLVSKTGPEFLEGFTLLFTTRVGPPNLREDYSRMLFNSLKRNIAADRSLADLLRQRSGLEIGQLQQQDLTRFFELGLPKVIANVLMEQDWYIDPNPGVLVFKFERAGVSPYKIIHFAMEVSRQSPPVDQREPKTTPQSVADAYKAFVHRLFETPAVEVTEGLVSGAQLKPSLEEITDRRRLFYPDRMG
jgi:hypothetical protein